MNTTSAHASDFHKRITFAGSLIAIGIVFGDIGTSPLYTLNAVFHDRAISADIALGSLSCIFWTLFFQTTLKYIIITLRADNKGEGGIFSLYALIRKYSRRWVVFVAMAGGAFLMADGIITPPISVASAIEGLKGEIPTLNTVPIIIVIIVFLFIFQQFGTHKIGRVFGPIMLVWFGFIGTLGLIALSKDWSVLKALNPYYAYNMLVNHPGGFWLLGSIFLCTTGAEALYSDMGHCGRNNIRVSWIFIKVMLILSYAGQTAWLVAHEGEMLGALSPFYHALPPAMYWPAIIIATLATIIASQALISGCFTLINEAIQLQVWPKHYVHFPSDIKGQLYIPAINWALMAGCIAMVLYFKESTAMEAAFGLSVTLTMLMSTVLVSFYLRIKRVSWPLRLLTTLLFLTIELSFLIANIQKIKEGGWITLVIGSILFAIMYFWRAGKRMKSGLVDLVPLQPHVETLRKLSLDEHITKYATNVVYLTTATTPHKIEQSILDSILNRGMPKRADIYWFIHVRTTDAPYEQSYTVDTIVKNDIYYVAFNLGFREEVRIAYLFRKVVAELIRTGEVDFGTSRERAYQQMMMGDFQFIIEESYLSYDNKLPLWKNLVMRSYYNLATLSVKKTTSFGLDASHTLIEKYPLVVMPYSSERLIRKEE